MESRSSLRVTATGDWRLQGGGASWYFNIEPRKTKTRHWCKVAKLGRERHGSQRHAPRVFDSPALGFPVKLEEIRAEKLCLTGFRSRQTTSTCHQGWTGRWMGTIDPFAPQGAINMFAAELGWLIGGARVSEGSGREELQLLKARVP